MASPLVEVVGVGRPFSGEDISGDAWLHLAYDWGHRIILVDGAGHGPTAAAAAKAALDSLRDTATLNFNHAFLSCHQALLHTRGAVLSFVDISESSLTFAGVGNVDGRLITPDRTVRFMPDRGLLGSTLPRVRPLTLELPSEHWFVLLHSDGISTRLQLEWSVLSDPAERSKHLNDALKEWGRNTDDATMVVVSQAAASER